MTTIGAKPGDAAWPLPRGPLGSMGNACSTDGAADGPGYVSDGAAAGMVLARDVEEDEDPTVSQLRSELESLKLREDSDDPKAALVDLLLQQWRDTGAAADVLPALVAGGEAAAGRCPGSARRPIAPTPASRPPSRQAIQVLYGRTDAVMCNRCAWAVLGPRG